MALEPLTEYIVNTYNISPAKAAFIIKASKIAGSSLAALGLGYTVYNVIDSLHSENILSRVQTHYNNGNGTKLKIFYIEGHWSGNRGNYTTSKHGVDHMQIFLTVYMKHMVVTEYLQEINF
ncbi:hypothetical protein PRVXT_000250 [Proteinivorax tanatarense]|uniref:Uncharacterized protein n=1 Tax=Proteinivorax tanatarense TaxID=1260629 RepID=A0AAU7VM63_9FIRM